MIRNELYRTLFLTRLIYPNVPDRGFGKYISSVEVVKVLQNNPVNIFVACRPCLDKNIVYPYKKYGEPLLSLTEFINENLSLVGYDPQQIKLMMHSRNVPNNVFISIVAAGQYDAHFIRWANGFDLSIVIDKLAKYEHITRKQIMSLIEESKKGICLSEAAKLLPYISSNTGAQGSWYTNRLLSNVVANTELHTIDEWFELFLAVKKLKGRTISTREKLAEQVTKMANQNPEKLIRVLQKVWYKEKTVGFWYTLSNAIKNVTHYRHDDRGDYFEFTGTNIELLTRFSRFFNDYSLHTKCYYRVANHFKLIREIVIKNTFNDKPIKLVEETKDASDSNA